MSLTRELFNATAQARVSICPGCGKPLAGCDQEMALEAGEKAEAHLREEIDKLATKLRVAQAELANALTRKP